MDQKNTVLEQGALRLRADFDARWDQKGRLYTYSSGMITSAISYGEKPSPPRFSFQYGYIEIRAKIPHGKGLWPGLMAFA